MIFTRILSAILGPSVDRMPPDCHAPTPIFNPDDWTGDREMKFNLVNDPVVQPIIDRMERWLERNAPSGGNFEMGKPLNPATVVFEQRGTGVYMHTAVCLLHRKDLTLPLTFRWDYDRGGWFWVRGHRG